MKSLEEADTEFILTPEDQERLAKSQTLLEVLRQDPSESLMAHDILPANIGSLGGQDVKLRLESKFPGRSVWGLDVGDTSLQVFRDKHDPRQTFFGVTYTQGPPAPMPELGHEAAVIVEYLDSQYRQYSETYRAA